MADFFDAWETELYHHGIKGQKWGVRRFQNEDGSWTEAGEARYGKEFKSRNRLFGLAQRTRLTDSDRFYGLGSRDLKEGRVVYYQNQVQRHAANPNSAWHRAMLRRSQAKLRAQEAANANRDSYDNRTSTATLWVQNKLLGSADKAERYRDARARGSGRARAFVEGKLSRTPLGWLMRRSGSRKTYGTTVKW